jgi:hypothetical protein
MRVGEHGELNTEGLQVVGGCAMCEWQAALRARWAHAIQAQLDQSERVFMRMP